MNWPRKIKTNRGQNLLELALLIVLVMGGIMVGGPYAINAWNAHIKGWEDSVTDSLQDPQQAALPTNPVLNICDCQWDLPSGCSSGPCCGQGDDCAATQDTYMWNCNPLNCAAPDLAHPTFPTGFTQKNTSACRFDDACCSDPVGRRSPENCCYDAGDPRPSPIDCGICGAGHVPGDKCCGANGMVDSDPDLNNVNWVCETPQFYGDCVAELNCDFQCQNAPTIDGVEINERIAPNCVQDSLGLSNITTDWSFVNPGACSTPAGGVPKCQWQCAPTYVAGGCSNVTNCLCGGLQLGQTITGGAVIASQFFNPTNLSACNAFCENSGAISCEFVRARGVGVDQGDCFAYNSGTINNFINAPTQWRYASSCDCSNTSVCGACSCPPTITQEVFPGGIRMAGFGCDAVQGNPNCSGSVTPHNGHTGSNRRYCGPDANWVGWEYFSLDGGKVYCDQTQCDYGGIIYSGTPGSEEDNFGPVCEVGGEPIYWSMGEIGSSDECIPVCFVNTFCAMPDIDIDGVLWSGCDSQHGLGFCLPDAVIDGSGQVNYTLYDSVLAEETPTVAFCSNNYGKLYTDDEKASACPSEYRLPTWEEWRDAYNFLEAEAAGSFQTTFMDTHPGSFHDYYKFFSTPDPLDFPTEGLHFDGFFSRFLSSGSPYITFPYPTPPPIPSGPFTPWTGLWYSNPGNFEDDLQNFVWSGDYWVTGAAQLWNYNVPLTFNSLGYAYPYPFIFAGVPTTAPVRCIRNATRRAGIDITDSGCAWGTIPAERICLPTP